MDAMSGTGGGQRVAVLGDSIKHFPAGQVSGFDVAAAGVKREDVTIHIISEGTGYVGAGDTWG